MFNALWNVLNRHQPPPPPLPEQPDTYVFHQVDVYVTRDTTSDFQLLCPQTDIHYDDDQLTIRQKNQKENDTPPLYLTFKYIMRIRQHLAFTVQLSVVQDSQPLQNFGFKFSTSGQAIHFRRTCLYMLWQTCTTQIMSWPVNCLSVVNEVEEFVPHPLSATADRSFLLRAAFRPTDNTKMLCLSYLTDDTTSEEQEEDYPSSSLEELAHWELDEDVMLWMKEPNTLYLYALCTSKDDGGQRPEKKLMRLQLGEECSAESLCGLSELVCLLRDPASVAGSGSQNRNNISDSDSEFFESEENVSEVEDEKDECSDDSREVPSLRAPRKSITWDPTEDILENNPNSYIHKFMEVCKTKKRTLVGRTAGHNSNQFEMVVYNNGDGMVSQTKMGSSAFEFEGSKLVPTSCSVFENENRLLLTSSHCPTTLYSMDIETGKVTDRWSTEYMPIKTTFETTSQVVKCYNSKSLFSLDTRMAPESAVCDTKCYTVNPQFCAAASDKYGHFVVGSETGVVRFYDGKSNRENQLKPAKNQMAPLQSPVVSVDVAPSGCWVVVTYRTRVCVMECETPTGDSLFVKSIPKDRRRNPIFLALKPDDIIRYSISDICFTPAVFNDDETSIFTSTGNIAVVWNVESIRKRKPFYTIKLTQSYIKDIKSIDSSNVCVAYPSEIDFLKTSKKRVSHLENR